MIRLARVVANTPHAPMAGVVAIALVTVARAVLEFSVVRYWAPDIFDYMCVSFGVAYILAFFLYLLALRIVAGWGYEKSGNPVAIGMVFGFFPPIIEMYFPSGVTNFAFFLTFAPSLFSAEQARGESIVLWLMVLSTGAYVGAAMSSWWRGILGVVAGWTLIHLSTVLVVAASRAQQQWFGDVGMMQAGTVVDVVMLVQCAALYLILRHRALTASLRRAHHALPHLALVAGGTAWASSAFDRNWLIVTATVFAVILTLLIHNDYYDREDDARASRAAGVEEFDLVWSTVFLGVYLWLLGAFAPLMAMLALVLWLAGTVYHHPSTRLKARFCLSYLCEGTGAATAFAMGAAGAASFPAGAPIHVPATFVFFGGALLSAAKDWKDVDADRMAGHATVYTLFSRDADGAFHVHRRLSLAVLGSMLAVPVLFWSAGAPAWASATLIPAALLTWAALVLVRTPQRSVSLAMVLYGGFLALAAWVVAYSGGLVSGGV